MIPDHIIDQVRDSADIVGIISESVPLKRTGADWRGACPFHGGKGRNFAVIPKKQMFYCYVCHEAGDVFSYCMKRFGMDYPTAVRDIARRVGITVPEEKASAGPDPNEPLLSAASAAHEFFIARLADGRDAETARQYLAGRGFDQAAIERHQFGYSPTTRDLLDHLEKLGISQDTAITAGLAIRRDDGSVGLRFRGRLIIPIHDLRAGSSRSAEGSWARASPSISTVPRPRSSTRDARSTTSTLQSRRSGRPRRRCWSKATSMYSRWWTQE